VRSMGVVEHKACLSAWYGRTSAMLVGMPLSYSIAVTLHIF
jgi:hypothetical protein